MKFKLLVCKEGDPENTWGEEHDKEELKSEAAVEAWGLETVMEFNAGLRPGEYPRVYQGVEIIGPSDGGIVGLATMPLKVHSETAVASFSDGSMVELLDRFNRVLGLAVMLLNVIKREPGHEGLTSTQGEVFKLELESFNKVIEDCGIEA